MYIPLLLINVAIAQSSTSYVLEDTVSGNDFFDYFDFFTGEDPTHGFVK